MTAPTLPPTASDGGEDEPRRPRLAERLRSARPRRPRLPQVTGLRAPWALSLLAAVWAAAIGLVIAIVPMLIAWMTSTSTSLTWTGALTLGGGVWVVAHGAPLTLAGVEYSLLPWGLVVVPAVLLGYAGSWAARRAEAREGRALLLLVVPGAILYAILVGAAAELTGSPTAHVPPLLAGLHGLVLATLALGWGVLRADGFTLDRLLPSWLAVAVRAGLVAAAALVGMGAVAATVSLLSHLDDAITMSQALGAGLGGGLVLLLLGVAYVPVMVMWGTAYLLGAGVIVGPGVTVSPFIGAMSPVDLPPFPLLAALPQGSTPLGWLLPLSGVLAGVLAGVMIGRRARDEQRLLRLALAGLAAVVSGALLGLGAVLASGGLGDEQLAQVGPTPLAVAILGAVLIGLGAAPSAVVPAPPERPRLAVANPPEDAPNPATVDDDHS